MYFYFYALEQPLVGHFSDTIGPRQVVGLWSFERAAKKPRLSINMLRITGARAFKFWPHSDSGSWLRSSSASLGFSIRFKDSGRHPLSIKELISCG